MMDNPYQAYKQQSVMTMTSGQMLIMVYNELIKQLNIAQRAFSEGDIPAINNSLQKSRRIVNELKGTLNFDYEISNNLNAIYDYFNTTIFQANINKDPAGLGDVLQMATELKDAFSEAAKTAHR